MDQASELFTRDMIIQLNTVFDKMERVLILRIFPDAREVSAELERYMTSLANMSEHLKVEREEVSSEEGRPYVRVLYEDGTETGLCYHGVPGGHEFTPFVLGLYNASGAGQPMADKDRRDVLALDKDISMKIMVSLNCTFCPELVQAAERIATLNPRVKVDVYDVNLFPALREKYNAQSVPCFVINDGKPQFGKKSLPALLELFAGSEEEG